MFMFCYFAQTANILHVFEAVSLCPYVAIIFYGEASVLPLCLERKHLVCEAGFQQSVRPHVAMVVVFDELSRVLF